MSLLKTSIVIFGSLVLLCIIYGVIVNINDSYKHNMKIKGSIIIHNDTGITFKDIIGNEDIKRKIMLYVDIIKHKDKPEYVNIEMGQGFIFHGLPGTGKTMMAKAIASEVKDINFVEIKINDLMVREVMETLAYIKQNYSPAIIFIDEIDKINYNSEMLEFMDGISTNKKEQKIIIIGCTNNYYRLSKALTRSGRLDKMFYFGYPSVNDKLSLFNIYLSIYNHSVSIYDADRDIIIEHSDLLTASDIKAVCVDAFVSSKLNNRELLTLNDLLDSIDQYKKLKRLDLNKPDKKSIAVYKAGQILMSYLLNTKNKITYSSINDLNNDDRIKVNINNSYKSDIFHDIIILLSGLISQKIYLNERTTYGYLDYKDVLTLSKKIYECGLLPYTDNVDEHIKLIEENIYPYIKNNLHSHIKLLNNLVDFLLSNGNIFDVVILKIIPNDLINTLDFKIHNTVHLYH